MGVDYSIPSLFGPATKKLQPLLEIALARRNCVYNITVQNWTNLGKEKSEAQELAKQDEEVKTEQRSVDRLLSALTSVEAGYFRDAYNFTSLISMFDLADLRLFGASQKDVPLQKLLKDLGLRMKEQDRWGLFEALLDKDACLQPDKAKAFLKLMEAREGIFYDRLDNFIEYFKSVTGTEITPAEAAEWTQDFDRRYKNFQIFLNKAIELNEAISVSY